MVIVRGTPYEVYADERITAKAKGLLAYLISRDGEHVTIERIERDSAEGGAAIRKAIKELEKYGYLERERYMEGRFAAYHWRVTVF